LPPEANNVDYRAHLHGSGQEKQDRRGGVARFEIAIVPIGRLDIEEIEAAGARAAKVLHEPVELRAALPVPHPSAEDGERGQHRAAALMTRLRQEVAKLGPGKLVGAADAEAKPPPRPGGFRSSPTWTCTPPGPTGCSRP
jgi:hypothetical protein